jgi:succinate dehydrogenase / fumarate reductase membrane anchor subunit
MSYRNAPAGIGSKRLVVGAHYGVGGFLAQRITAVILGVYTLFFAVLLLMQTDLSYEGWASLFAPLWMKVVTLVTVLAMLYHAWTGVRDIWMDYIKPTWLRLTLSTATLLWLFFCAVWAVQILWRV